MMGVLAAGNVFILETVAHPASGIGCRPAPSEARCCVARALIAIVAN